ncbi:MAG TPA: hypothetical protein VHL50_08915 [Pyrinomonadaceae bacterium]|nr:hypothetical protein [Pyrinomonadaceae bacterium]
MLFAQPLWYLPEAAAEPLEFILSYGEAEPRRTAGGVAALGKGRCPELEF